MTDTPHIPGAEIAPENGWVLIKRGLYWRPNAQGYTGILSQAGLYSDEDSAARLDEGVTRQRFTEAAEVSGATFIDIACDYWREQALAAREALAARIVPVASVEHPFHWKHGICFALDDRAGGPYVIISQYDRRIEPCLINGEVAIPLAEWKSAVRCVTPSLDALAVSPAPNVPPQENEGVAWTRDDLAIGLAQLDNVALPSHSLAEWDEYRERADDLLAHLSLSSPSPATAGAGEPTHFAGYSASGMHIGLWTDRQTAEAAMSDMPVSSIIPLYSADQSRVERLETALRQISNMKTLPDDKANRFTLVAAHKIAAQALGDRS